MRVLQFAFSYWPNDLYLPHNYIPNCIAYTGTHDNNTTSIKNKQQTFEYYEIFV
jgi:4-alpha-glucanotransferase